jgi:hypothetical protein
MQPLAPAFGGDALAPSLGFSECNDSRATSAQHDSPTAVRIGSPRMIGVESGAHMAVVCARNTSLKMLHSLAINHRAGNHAATKISVCRHALRPNCSGPVQRICSICSIARYRRSKFSAMSLQFCVYWHVHTSLRAILPRCDSSDRLHMECGPQALLWFRWGLVCDRSFTLAFMQGRDRLLTCWPGALP